MYSVYRLNGFPVRGCMVLAVLVGLMGCGSKRKVLRQSVVRQESSRVVSSDSVQMHTESATQRVGSKVVQVEWTQTVYDTSAPVNPVTGLHPVKSQSRATSRVVHDEAVQQVQRSDSQAVQRQQVQRQQREQQQSEQEHVRKRPAWLLQGAVLCLAMAVLLGVYGYCSIRRRRG